MTTVSTKWPLGSFHIELMAELTDEQRDALTQWGLRYLGQRNGEVDRILGAFEKDAEGKSKRKANWKRGDVEYSEELAEALKASFATLSFPDDTKETPHLLEGVAVSIEKYEGGGKEPAFAREKDAVKSYLAANGGKLKSGEDRTVASFCENRGIEVPEDASKWSEDTEFLGRVKAWLKEVAAAE